jgi:hypothetical protein
MQVPPRGQRPCPIVSSVIDDVAKVGWIATIFTLSAVLSYPPMSIVVSQVPVFASWGSFFTSGMLCLIGRLVTNRGLAPMVSS